MLTREQHRQKWSEYGRRGAEARWAKYYASMGQRDLKKMKINSVRKPPPHNAT